MSKTPLGRLRPSSGHRRALLRLAVTCGLLHGCSGSEGGSLTPAAETNLRLPVLQLNGESRLWIAAVYEVDAGGADLNGDGDGLDAVYHAYDARTGRLTNLGVAAFGLPIAGGGDTVPPHIPQIDGDHAVLIVDEWRQGQADLNGDGDSTDSVAMVFDAETGTLSNLGLAVLGHGEQGFSLSHELVFLGVDEGMQGQNDLNADGEINTALFLYDVATGTIENLQRALGANAFRITDREVGLFLRETAGVDLNGDGDALDTVFQVFDITTRRFASSNMSVLSPSTLVADDLWAFAVSEFTQGGADLNGDGDAFDQILHTFDPASGVVDNLGLATRGFRTVEGENFFAVLAQENEASSDLNGDGDRFDEVLFLHDVTSGTSINLGLATTRRFDGLIALDGWLALGVSEAQQGEMDLNLDGDADDTVLYVSDPATGSTVSLGTTSRQALGAGRYLASLQSEFDAGADPSGDGDLDDLTLQVWDGLSQLLHETGITASALLDARGDSLLLVQREEDLARDVNGDGDTTDAIGAIYSFSRAELRSLGISIALGEITEAGTTLALVLERSEGRDLNGDGDMTDAVLHLFP